MINVENRVPLRPGRVRLDPVAGTPNVYDMKREDQPQVAGTPLDRNTMRLLQADIRSYPVKAGESVQAGDVVDVAGGMVTTKRPIIGSLPVGSTIKLKVGGKPTEFIVVQHGKPSPIYSNTFNGATVLLIKDNPGYMQWSGYPALNDYAASAIHAKLNSEFLGKLDAGVAALIKQVKIPYRVGEGYGTTVASGENGLLAKIWLPSGYELGWTNADYAYFPADGAKFAYFLSGTGAEANKKRICYRDGAARGWWTRSPFCSSGNGSLYGWIVKATGECAGATCDSSWDMRPALVLPDAFCDYDIDDATSQAIALTSGSGGQNVDVLFDGTAELPGVKAGTSITSPGVRGYSPIDGWIWVKPWWEERPCVIGSYVPDSGTGIRTISLGFSPSAILFWAYEEERSVMNEYYEHPAAVNEMKLLFQGQAFRVVFGVNLYASLKLNGQNIEVSGDFNSTTYAKEYHYIAFRE